MQRLPLLLVANPREARSGPIVRLSQGKWKIVYKGIIDTIVRIVSLPLNPVNKEFVSVIDGPLTVQCIVLKPGHENNISVFVDRVN
jgi:hypothetical protein